MQKNLVLPAEFSEVREASGTDGGTALTTTATCIDIPFGSDWLSLIPHDFVTASVVKYLLNPYLTIIHTTDNLVLPGNAADISDEAQDNDTTNMTFTTWPTLANGGALYVGAPLPFRGVKVTVGTTVQTVAAVLTIKYFTEGGGWVDTTNSEGTKVVGDCLQKDGTEEWAPAATWAKTSLIGAGETLLSNAWSMAPLYWTRWETDAAFTASSQLAKLQALNRSTSYAQLPEGFAIQQHIHTKRSSDAAVGCVEALTDAGEAKLIANVATVSVHGASSRERFE